MKNGVGSGESVATRYINSMVLACTDPVGPHAPAAGTITFVEESHGGRQKLCNVEGDGSRTVSGGWVTE